jgi:hypothetical protein
VDPKSTTTIQKPDVENAQDQSVGGATWLKSRKKESVKV